MYETVLSRFKEQATEIINYEKKKKDKKMMPLTNEEKTLHCKQKEFSDNDKNIKRLEIIVITLENIVELLMIFTI